MKHLQSRLSFTCLFLLVLSICSISTAQSLRDEVESTIRDAILFGVDEEKHRQFWANLTPSDKLEVVENISILEEAQIWQEAFWDSASKIASAGKIVRSKSYEDIFKNLTKRGSIIQIKLKKAEAMLKNIAKGNPIELPPDAAAAMQLQSNKIVVTEQIANFIRDNAGVSIDRLRVLYSEKWPPKQQTYLYPDQGLKYFASIRLAFTPADYGIRGLTAWESQQTLGNTSFLEISVLDYSGTAGIDFGFETILEGFRQMGVEPFRLDSGQWLGLPFHEYGATYNLGDTVLYTVFKTVVDQRNRRTYNFTVSSQDNILEAANLMQMFKLRLSLIK